MKPNGNKPNRGPAALPRLALAAAGLLAWAGLASYAQAPAAKNSYNNYRLVQTRNIFDPDRSRDLTWNDPNARHTEAPRPTPPPAVVEHRGPADYVELTGVMTTEEETFAFFAGSRPEYNKVLALNGSIAGATITKINSSGIEITRDGKKIDVPVGMTVPLDDSAPGLPPFAGTTTMTEGEATPATTTTTSVDPQGASQQVPVPDAVPGASPAPAPAGESNIDAIRRRLEERRKQELNQ